MNSDQYQYQHQHSPQNKDLQYHDVFDSNPNQHHQHLAYGSFDGLTQAQPEQNYLTSLSPPVTSFYGFEDSTTTSQPANTWIPPTSAPSSFSERNANRKCYSFAVNGHGRGHEQLTNPDYSIPRSLPLLFDASMSNHGMPLNPFIDTSVYNTMEPADSEEMQQIMSGRGDFHHRDSPFDMENTRSLARMSISHSPLGNEVENDLFDSSVKVRAPSSEPCDENHTISRGTTVVDVEEHGVEEPYAKLIYRALMSAPDHSMVLQDIYRWFRQNTTKGNDDTKGWMNSIRHNLSMNAAFKKTERKIHGDETKKSTEWVLEEFAIKDGVQSTTRYRKGTKKLKSEPYNTRHGGNRSRLVPRTSKPRQQELRRDPPRRIDTGAPLTNYSLPRAIDRRLSPLTPDRDPGGVGSPYFMHKREPYAYEEHCFSDVHGVFDDEPLFTNNSNSQFMGVRPLCTSQRY